MTDRREDDPEGFNGAPMRNGPALRMGFRGMTLSVWGASVFMALAAMAIIFANLYAGYRIEQAVVQGDVGLRTMAQAEHRMIRGSIDRLVCVTTLSKEDLATVRREYRPGVLGHYCPWIAEP